ncbi:MAG: hypothetical protein JJU21_00035 [Salinarimonas sp.]|nr:hypothetical protein [Salinarimonas sp.]
MSKSGLGQEDDLRALEPSTLRRPRRARAAGTRGRTRWRRIARRALIFKAVLVLIVALAFAAFYWRVSSEPVRFAGLTSQITSTLEAQLGTGWRIEIGDAALNLHDGRLALEVTDIAVFDPQGGRVANAPAAFIPVSTWSLVAGAPRAHGLELVGVELRLQVTETGALSLTTPEEDILLTPELEAELEITDPTLLQPDAATADAPLQQPAIANALAAFLAALTDPTSPIGSVAEAGLVDARLTLVDANGNENAGFRNIDARFLRVGDGRRIEASLLGGTGAWHIEGAARPRDGGGSEAALRIADIPVNDLLMFAGLSRRYAEQNLALSIDTDLQVDERNEIESFSARLETTPGRFFFDDPDAPILSFGPITAAMNYDRTDNAITIPEIRYTRDDTLVLLRGNARPDPDSNDWQVYLAGRDVVLSALGPGERDVVLPMIDLHARMGPSGVLIEELALSGDGLDVVMTLSAASPADAGGVRGALEARDVDVRDALRIWPRFVAFKPREYLVETLRAGRLESLSLTTTLTGEDFVNMRKPEEALLVGPLPLRTRDLIATLPRDGLPPEAIDLSFTITDATFLPDPGLPPLENVRISGLVTGRSATLSDGHATVALADGRELAMTRAEFAFDDFWALETTAAITFRLGGGADALASLMRAPLIARDTPTFIEPDTLSGNAVLDVALAPHFSVAPGPHETQVAVTGRLSDITLSDAFADEDLDEGSFTLSYRNGALDLVGEARLGEDAVALTVSRPRDAPLALQLETTLDAAARARRGIDLGAAITGALPLNVATELIPGSPQPYRVEADLTDLAFAEPLPGLVKPAGRSGRLAFSLSEDDGWLIRDLDLEAGPTRIGGTVRLDAQGGFVSADLSPFRITSGDDARLEARASEAGLRVDLRAESLDARAFLGSVTGEGAPTAGGNLTETWREINLDLRADIFSGHNGEALTNARMGLLISGDEVRRFDLDGRFPGAAVSGRMGLTPQGRSMLAISSEDAGATLRFIDLYTRMGGGALDFQIAAGGAERPGRLVIRDFVLRDEPALRNIASQAARGQDALNVAETAFAQARIDFMRSGSRITFEEAAMWGAQIGFRLDGFVDMADRVMDLSGTFVPAYAVNNAFAQVPLFGPLLGGGRREGLLGVNFRVSGPMSEPTLTVNPLSAIAPGFLRRLFEAGGPGAYGSPGQVQ